MKRILNVLMVVMLGLGFGISLNAAAQHWPERPIRLIVGVPPGGGADMIARLLAEALNQELGQPVIVENRPGAGGNIAANDVARAQPDGYTLLLANSSHAVNISLYKNLSFDPLADFSPIAQVTENFFFLTVRRDLPADDLRALVKLAQQRDTPVSYASGGVGQGAHLGMAAFVQAAGFEAIHVPYPGMGPAAVALLGGHVDMVLLTPPAGLPHIRAGNIRALAVTAPRRLASMPEIPTVAEVGYPGFEVNNWQGILAPARTPDAVVSTLHNAIVRALQHPKVLAQLQANDTHGVGSTPQAFRDFLQREIDTWAVVVKQTGAIAN